MAESICSSVGCGVRESRATAVRIWPDWQYPHCGTSTFSQAIWTGCMPSGERPSMVVMGSSVASETSIWQERTALPLIRTVQAPQDPMPQPYLGPV